MNHEEKLRTAQQRAQEAEAAWAADIFSVSLRSRYIEAQDQLLVEERAAADSRGEPYADVWQATFPWPRMLHQATMLGGYFESIVVFESPQGFVKLVFHHPMAVRFLEISDETIAGHELYGRGLAAYDRIKVMRSPLVEELRRVDAVHPQHDPSRWASAQHFMLLFKDFIYEVVVRDEPRFEILPSREAALSASLELLER